MKKDKKLIPVGYYCYTNIPGFTGRNPPRPGIKRCPYWKYISKYNAYCGYLGKDDIAIASKKTFTVKYSKNKNEIGMKLSDMPPELGASLLWDQCKECNIKIHGNKR
jgi:hypothetical protein